MACRQRRVGWIAGVLVVAGVAAVAAAEVENLARGRPVRFAPPPNYHLTGKGGTDANDLTDGKLSAREDHKLWFDPAAVGWSYAGPAQLAVDLGAARPVGEVAIRLQAGSPQNAGITTPVWVRVLASDDGRRFHAVARYSRFEPDAAARFGLGRDDGTARVVTLRFGELNVRARHVGIELYGASLSVSDELFVRPAATKGTCKPAGAFPPDAFTVTAPRLAFHKPVLHVPVNLDAPTPVGWIVPDGWKSRKVAVTLDLPPGVRFTGGRMANVELATAAGKDVGGGYRRYAFTFHAGTGARCWRRMYLRADAPGPLPPLRYRVAEPGTDAPLLSAAMRGVRVDPVRPPERLMTGLGWFSFRHTRDWPGAMTAWRTMGLNTVPCFARWLDLEDPDVLADLRRFREAGFGVMNIDSTFHHMLAKAGPRKGELLCRLPGGKAGGALCPSYRGELYERELDRVANQCARVRASILSCDIELWGWRGPTDCRSCSRCKAHHQAAGAEDWDAWKLDRGEEMWRDLAARVRAACAAAGTDPPEMGAYDFRPGKAYQSVWPFDRLYPMLMDNSQVSTYTPLYPYHLGLIGDEVRADRRGLAKSDVLPWITPGDAGTFPGEAFTHALLECYANGARGVHFWSGRVWDTESLAALARAIRIVAPVEDVLVDGELIDGVTTDPPVRVSGMRCGREAFLLLADYRSPTPRTVTVHLGGDASRTEVVDAESRRPAAVLTGGEQTFEITLPPRGARALHVRRR